MLVPGRTLWLAAAPTTPPGRRPRATAWSAVLVEDPPDRLVSLVTTLPNRLVGTGLRERAIAELADWRLDRAEAPLGRSRIDFVLRRGDERMAMEVKSVTLVERGVAMFPDAVTARGVRHLEELMALRAHGWHASVFFVVQRDDAVSFAPASHIDPRFAETLVTAHDSGVNILCRRCRVTLDGVRLDRVVAVDLERPGTFRHGATGGPARSRDRI